MFSDLKDLRNNATHKGKESQDDGPVVLLPALYHDVPTNLTVTSSSTDDPNNSSSAVFAVAPSSSPSPTVVQTSTCTAPLLLLLSIATYFTHFMKSIFRFFLLGGSFLSSSKLKSGPSGQEEQQQQQQEVVAHRLGVTIVCISDTHGEHEKLSMPEDADMLICAGDYTKFGKKEQLLSFNEWLGKLPYRTKIVVNGNHECNAMWKRSAKSLLSNAILLVDEGVEVELESGSESESESEPCHDCDSDKNGEANDEQKKDGSNELDNNLSSFGKKKNSTKEKLKIYGTNFYWPCDQGTNPYFDQIDDDSSIDILISHCPALGYVDNNRGCPALLNVIQNKIRPKIVISGHEHTARGIHYDQKSGVTFVNAANAKGGIRNGHAAGKQPIILTL